jgi:predicted transcriptional regulator
MCYEIEEVAALMGNTPQSIRNYIKDHEEMISNNPSYQDLFINVLKKIE